jgi:accessory colonization factor AcfC
MKTDLNNILIFKTNIQTSGDQERVQDTLDALDTIQQWNIDLNDVDCVLRIVSETLKPEQIISVINDQGFECAELE